VLLQSVYSISRHKGGGATEEGQAKTTAQETEGKRNKEMGKKESRKERRLVEG
jgi:hypothetical protein